MGAMTSSAGRARVRMTGAQRRQQLLDIGRELLGQRGYDAHLAELYSQALVGMVALVGQWWLDTRSPGKREVAAHLVNLAYNGLSHLEPSPGLVGKTARPA